MNKVLAPAEWQSERRLLRWLLLAYCLFIIYGSFMPFRFSTAPDSVLFHLSSIQLFPYQDGVRHFSLSDVVSNILLFIPFGGLAAGVLFSPPAGRRPWTGAIFIGG